MWTRNHVKRIERNCGEIPMKNKMNWTSLKKKRQNIKQWSGTAAQRGNGKIKWQQQINRFSFLVCAVCFACSIQFKNRFSFTYIFCIEIEFTSFVYGWLVTKDKHNDNGTYVCCFSSCQPVIGKDTLEAWAMLCESFSFDLYTSVWVVCVCSHSSQ